jgi:hypothetical protein
VQGCNTTPKSAARGADTLVGLREKVQLAA